ncbi:discoidin domain-containing receptor 2-like [Rhopalosiphum maidis]|uniref:discoidin domain-containing receptor 2-like n=1 Tax=Rhopalosiphum maidis TaxID=43146 RepID=UPI000F005AF1|nr:discoidin domain-containing receptor 2-like [Rhopalosiphum maidis]XP_026809568.1 discoidin domain-containing receptor 2-like [Rhopalosiphum maidis]
MRRGGARDFSIVLAVFAACFIGQLTLGIHIRECDEALGMESGAIPDSAITASSSYNVPNVGPSNGRLKVERAGGGWCPKPPVEQGVREWLQVDFGSVHMITGVQTQGRFGHGRGLEYAEEYTLEYWRPGLGEWKPYKRWDGKQIMSGNTDTSTVVLHHLLPPVYASQVRILPYSVHRRTVCLRAEIRGCPSDHGITSYTIPLDGPASDNTDVADLSYDGVVRDDKIQGGLGRLVDGVRGEDNYKMDIGYGKGNGWVGWRKESFSKGFVELIFEFSEVRNFSAVHIFTNNFFSKNVQVFSKARVQFSVGGLHYHGRSVWYTYMPDTVLENARDVDIQLHNHVGKYVKIQLYFYSKWIMISEVKFDSEPLAQNVTVDADAPFEDEQIVGGAVDPPWDSPDTTAHKEKDNRTGGGLVEVLIGVLTAATLILLGICAIVLALSRRKKHQTISTSIFKKPFGVAINMKDIFMNLSPHNNNTTAVSNNKNNNHNHGLVIGGGNRHITENPLAVGEQMRSDSFASDAYDKSQHVVYETPLLARKDYETIRSSKDARSTISAKEFCRSDSERGSLSSLEIDVRATEYSTRDSVTSLHYRSLQSQPPPPPVPIQVDAPVRPKHLQCSNTDIPTTRKRFHTAPREKHRMAPPSVSWNISPSMGQVYKCREADIVQIPRYCLNVVSKLGGSHLGEVAVCDTTMDVRMTDNGRVAAKTCNSDSIREVKFLCSLLDPNLVRVFGVCTNESPPWLITEYPAELGDLVIVLRTHSTLTYTTLMFMATQIASAMKYLESKNVVHKDLAARNCLVSRGYSIKVADVAVCNPAYKKDYSEIGNRPPAPIRWLPWESILLDRYTCPSTVWSFAVTMWELLNMARDKPFPHLTNEQVIHNAEQMYYGGELQVLLPKPNLCPTEIYELMCQCWKRDQNLRPTFKQLYHFLKRNHTTYSCEIDKQLHNVSPM